MKQTGTATARILIADDQPGILLAFRLLLAELPAFEIVGEATDSQELVTAVNNMAPDLLLLDWELPGKPSLDQLRQIRPGLQIAAMSSRPEAEEAALSAGATIFISKGALPEQVVTAVASLLPAS
jgi:DNA-binding NarL/FixJ family response regulator